MKTPLSDLTRDLVDTVLSRLNKDITEGAIICGRYLILQSFIPQLIIIIKEDNGKTFRFRS